jgi:hypothetical protein
VTPINVPITRRKVIYTRKSLANSAGLSSDRGSRKPQKKRQVLNMQLKAVSVYISVQGGKMAGKFYYPIILAVKAQT